jgi:hypothetical protein
VVREPLRVLVLTAERLATRFRQRQACPAASTQTTIGGWRVRVGVASRVCRKQSELFSLDRAQGVEHQLDDAVVLEGR